MTATLRGERRVRSASNVDDKPHLSRLQRSILWVLEVRGRVWLVDVACELRNDGATADMVKEALHGLMQAGFVCLSDGTYEVTTQGKRLAIPAAHGRTVRHGHD